ncbi:MAG: UDP-N-acetylmuramate dehydrogenase [Planctomycetota bacterium]
MRKIIRKNVSLSPYTTFKVGGEARFFAVPSNFEELSYSLKFAQDKSLNIFILGKGSNVLVSDEGVEGLVISTQNLKRIEFKDSYVIVESGYPLKKLILETLKKSFSGLECLAQIPASIGGCVFMNAGGKFGSIGSVVERCWVVNFADSSLVEFDSTNLQFSYRYSNLQNFFIYKVALKLQPSNEKIIYDKLLEVIDYKARTQPLSTNNAGCIFKNPANHSAGILIEQCGLKGYRIGDVYVSPKHSNFFVNNGSRAENIMKLIELVQKKVFEEFGIKLEREIKIWPDEPNYKF